MEVDQQEGPAKGWTWEEAKPVSAGHWEDKGIAGKVWHPDSGTKEGNRVDNQVGGFPPELAALGGLGLSRSIAGASGHIAMRIVKGLGASVSPIIKYEAVRTGLTSMGISPSVAALVAAGVSGIKGKASTAEAAAKVAPTAEEAMGLTSEEAAASRKAMEATPQVVSPSPTPAPTAPPTAAAPTLAPTPPVVAPPQATAPAMAAPPQGPMPPVITSAAELAEFHRMVQQGTPWQKALQLIVAQRGMIQRMGLPTPNAAADAVAARNAGGGWQ